MESIYTELALYGTKNECARTDNVFSQISEICDGTVSLSIFVFLHFYSLYFCIFGISIMHIFVFLYFVFLYL